MTDNEIPRICSISWCNEPSWNQSIKEAMPGIGYKADDGDGYPQIWYGCKFHVLQWHREQPKGMTTRNWRTWMNIESKSGARSTECSCENGQIDLRVNDYLCSECRKGIESQYDITN